MFRCSPWRLDVHMWFQIKPAQLGSHAMASTIGAGRYESQIVVQVRYLQRRLEQILGMSEKSRLLPPKKMVISLGKNFLRWITMWSQSRREVHVANAHHRKNPRRPGLCDGTVWPGKPWSHGKALWIWGACVSYLCRMIFYTYIFVCLPIDLSIHPYIHPSFHPSMFLSLWKSLPYIYIYINIDRFIYISYIDI